MYYMQEHHEPIISERMFNQAQEILQEENNKSSIKRLEEQKQILKEN